MKFKKQKYINLIVFILATGFLSGCGDSSGDRVATDPTDHTPHKEKVYLKESFTGGHVSSIDFQVLLPSGTKQSLLEYNGQVSITGSIQMTPPCVKGSHSFNCQAQLSSRSINLQNNNCSISQGVQLWRIDIGSAQELKTTYSVIGVATSTIPPNCYLPQQQ